MKKITEKEENDMYQIINDSLLSLCEEKPNNPVEYLSKKMLQLIFNEDDINRKKRKLSRLEMENVNISLDKFSVKSLTKKFSDYYRILHRIGVGEHGETFLVEDTKFTDLKRVVKIVTKPEEDSHNLTENSIELLISLEHPNIVKIHEIIEDEKHLYIVQDLCEGGDLFSYLIEHKILNEHLLKVIIKQIFDALNYLHQKNIIHRDLKPENILIVSKNYTSPKDITIKLNDYGLFEFLGKRKNAVGRIAGLPLYTAPEVIEGKYDYKCDLWSVGVISYTLLCGVPPYNGNAYELFYKILHKDFEFKDSHSEAARDFISGMMIKDPRKRPEIKEAMEHLFLASEDEEVENENNNRLEILSNMSKFFIGKNLKRSVLNYILSRKLYNESNNSLLKLFKEIDKDGNGQIDVQELYDSYGKFFPGTPETSWEKVKLFVERVDINNNGMLEYSEFLAVSSILNNEINQKSMRDVFNQYDKDNNGYIQAADLKDMFGDTDLAEENLELMIQDYDQDGDRKISFDEFYDMITKTI